MGALEGLSGAQPNGLLPGGAGGVTRVLDGERWAKAEARTAELIECIQPTWPSEERRNAVANYVQRLIMKCFSCRVFMFGSVPLKTYLPDGDIDLTAMSENENLKDTWATRVRDILESEERNANAEFHVKEVQYIQAEVKIIKCLVENIVVDISFNQVGGLCTLCFLDEIDHLINQSHLFKRSIILIKAWCYYESRILGAHHGLISTYALETLVLYTFHVFNNTFAGPLEVLYRFLEIFSNFDWDKYGVSLWGPLPLSSLADMTVDAPRKDSGELLLNKLFLQRCSTVYAVFPGGERQGHPFHLKHFNVIDPLRTNNNLGRSVSKGNFFRIRSAFSFGAKMLGRLLDCPKENLITEFNQFFKNTWERHGSGHRPDAPGSLLLHPMPVKSVLVDESNISRTIAGIKKKIENAGIQVGHKHQSEGDQFERNNTQQSQNTYRLNYLIVASHSQSLKSHGSRMNARDSDQFEINNSSCGPVQTDEGKKSMPSDFCVGYHEGKGRFQFLRTQSSPELTETSTDVMFRGTRSRAAEIGAKHNDHMNIRNTLGSEVSSGHSVRSFDDPSSLTHGSSNRSLAPIFDPDRLSSNYRDDSGFHSVGEDPASVSQSLDMQQEAQDLVNMMASSRLHNFNDPVQLPLHSASPHLPHPVPPVLTSTGYSQRNFVGLGSPNSSSVEPSWRSSMQFTQGFVSTPNSHYFPLVGMTADNDHIVDSGNESSGMTEVIPRSDDWGIWHAHDAGSTSGFGPNNGGFQMLPSDEMKQSNVFNYTLPLQGNNSTSSVMRSQHKFVSENRVPSGNDYSDAVPYQTTKGTNVNCNDRDTTLRFSPVSQASSRSQTSVDSSGDESLAKVFKTVRDKSGKKVASSAVMTSMSAKANSRRQFEDTAENISGQKVDSRKWVPLSTINTDMTERVIGSACLPSAHVGNHQISGYRPSQTSEPGSMIPIPPFLVGSSHPRVVDNSGGVPYVFYPTGLPVPLLTMFPVYNLPSENSDCSRSQINQVEREDRRHILISDKIFDSTENCVPPEVHVSSTYSTDVAPLPSVELKPDIFNSDFPSHWQNLQFGRLCQTSHNRGQLVYPSPVMVPPVYLQGNFPWNGPGRPHSGNMITQIVGYRPRLLPMPLQPGSSRPPGVLQCYGDEAPRFRGGTGTFIPNTKVNFRDRQFSNTRNHRGNYNCDRSDHSDREGSWISPKARAAGRSHGRSHTEKSNTRLDRSVGTDNRADRLWDSHRREPVALGEVRNNSYGSSNSSHSSANMANGMYPLPTVGSKGVCPMGDAVPSVMMLHPYDEGAGDGSLDEQLEFGFFGPTRPSGMSETPQPTDGNPVRELYHQRSGMHQGDSLRTSLHLPTPHVRRSTVRRNYQLKDEDFSPVISN